MEEIWKDIEGFEGSYQVSNLGRVKSFHRGKWNNISPCESTKGYLQVFLHKNGKRKRFFVHRLVAQAFIPNPDNLPQINHKDEDKANNMVDNLEWCTAEYNLNYGTRNKRASEKMRNGEKSKVVYQYTLKGEFIKEWPSLGEVGRQLGFSEGTISSCCLGKTRQNYGYGYLWRYACDVEYKHTDIAPHVEFQYKNRKDQSKRVYQYTIDGDFIKEWPSTKEVERELGFPNGYIGACCRNKRKTAYGFVWRYEYGTFQLSSKLA